MLGDGVCDEECANYECLWDFGDCGTCALGCLQAMIGDGVCDEPCANEECDLDGHDCGDCYYGCFNLALGDGVCNTECLVPECNFDHGDCDYTLCSPGCYSFMLNDRICQPACNNTLCGFDGEDCYCMPGCSLELLSNDECDPDCRYAECGYDAGRCVSSTQGDCAFSCFESMIGNGVCDEDCQFAECRYDERDCGCAPGCYFWADSNCPDPCLVPDCHYNDCWNSTAIKVSLGLQIQSKHLELPENFDQDCFVPNPQCDPLLVYFAFLAYMCTAECTGCAHSFGTCYGFSNEVNPGPGCLWGWGPSIGECIVCKYFQIYNYCTDACTRAMPSHDVTQTMCIPAIDDSSNDFPDAVFVTSSQMGGNRGTAEDPFFSVAVAFAQNYMAYAYIYLLEGTHELRSVPISVPEGVLLESEFDPLNNTFGNRKVTVMTLMCTGSEVDLGQCANDRAIIKIVDFSVTLSVLCEVIFDKVIFDGSTSLVYGCVGMFCYYCPNTFHNNDGLLIDDHGNIVNETAYAPQSLCDLYHNVALFRVYTNSTLTLNEVDFINILYQPKAVIYSSGGLLTLSDVVFRDVIVKSGAVILQDECGALPYGCGSLYYRRGSVSYLNNGYEIVESLRTGGFLKAIGLRDIVIESVTFEKNVMAESNLISLSEFRMLQIENCTFEVNVATYLILVDAPKLEFEERIDENGVVIDFSIEHFAVKRSNFTKNLTEKSLISISHALDLPNFTLQNCTFISNFFLNSALLSLSYLGTITPSLISGKKDFVTSEDGEIVLGFFAPSFITIQSTSFLSNIGVTLLSFTNMVNILISNSCKFTANGSSTVITFSDVVMQEFFSDQNSYIQNTVESISASPCSTILLISKCRLVTLSSLSLSHNTCNAGPAGITVDYLPDSLTISNLTFDDNQSKSQIGSVLSISESSGFVQVSNTTFSRNSDTNFLGLGIVFFGPGTNSTITQCRFVGNQVKGGGGGLWAQDSLRLEIRESEFDSNIATGSGGGLYVMPGSGDEVYRLIIVNCDFKNNESKDERGGALFIFNNKRTRPYQLLLSSTTFEYNFARTLGSTIYIDSTLNISSSEITNCSFTANRSARGSIALFFSSGTITISQSSFYANEAMLGAGITCSIQPEAELIISDTVFEENVSAGGTVALSDVNIVKTLRTSNCRFERNSGIGVALQNGIWTDAGSEYRGNSGSSVWLSDESVAVIRGSMFDSNSATFGGAVYLANSASFNCIDCYFGNNSAEEGGAIFLQQSAIINITESLFEANHCKDKGSAVFFLSCLTPVSTISASNFTGNSADNSGVISLLASELAIFDAIFDENTAQSVTPGIALTLSHLSVSNSIFARQHGGLGGFLYATTESTASMSNTSFDTGYAQSGGAFNVIGSSLFLIDCSLFDISAESGGGFMAFSQSHISLIRVSMTKMNASDSAIGFISEGSLYIVNCFFSEFSIGGIKADRLTTATIHWSSFTNGNGLMGGGFACTRCRAIFIGNSLFRGIDAKWGGALYLTTQSDVIIEQTYQIQHTLFSANSAGCGGAVYSNNVGVGFLGCEFRKNSARKESSVGTWGRGGAVAPDCSDISYCNISFVECSFVHNWAEVSGGAIDWEDVRPVDINNEFKNNTAFYGNDFSSFPVSLQLQPHLRFLSDFTLFGLPSGQRCNQTLKLVLTDHYGHVVGTDSSSIAELAALQPNTTVVSGVSKVTAKNGIFIFDDFIVTAEPKSTTQLQVLTLGVDSTRSLKAKDSFVYVSTVNITAKMRECVIGESHVGAACQVCDVGKYSIDPESPSCKNCPDEAICYGNFTMVPRAGYWRQRIDSDLFHKCLQKEACIGSLTPPANLSLTGDCAIGYEGRLCGSCSRGFSKDGKYGCAACPEQFINIIRLSLIGLGVACLMTLLVVTTMKTAHLARSQSSVYLKIMMNYLQIVILAASFNLSWPREVVDFFTVQETAGSYTEHTISIDCFLTPENAASDVVVYNKLIVISVAPVAFVAISTSIWMTIYLLRRKAKFPTDALITTVVIVLFMCHPTLTKYLFNFYTCLDLEGRHFLLQQLNIECWHGKHSLFSVICALPAVISWVIGVPAACLFYFIRNKRRVDSLRFKTRFGFLYSGYKQKAYYWEFVILYRKIAVISCSVFLTIVSIPIQALCVLFILVAAMYAQDAIKPFHSADYNTMELRSIMCAAVTIYCGLFFLTGDLSTSAKYFLLASIVLVNGYFLCFWAWKVFGYYIVICVNRVPCLRRRLGVIHKVPDGLPDDLLVRKKCQGAFQLPGYNNRAFTPMVKEHENALNSMKDLYLMKLRWKDESDSLEIRSPLVVSSVNSSSVSMAGFEELKEDSAFMERDISIEIDDVKVVPYDY